MLKIMVRMLLISSVVMVLASCATTTTTTVSRVDTDSVQDLSGQWNDTDSRLVSARMVNDLLARKWLTKYQVKHDRNPVVIVGKIRNLSHEHINTRTFIADLERELVNSGEVEFVASSREREEIRDERDDQAFNASAATANDFGQETGADFMLKGQINTIFDAAGRQQVKYYQVDLTLISLKDNRKVWLGQKKIKKIIKHASYR